MFPIYIILFFITSWMVSSCKTTETAKTTPTQTRQPAGYNIAIHFDDSGIAMSRVIDRIHQSVGVTGIQVKRNDNFINPDCEIQVLITAITVKQINELRGALYAIPEVKMIEVSQN